MLCLDKLLQFIKPFGKSISLIFINFHLVHRYYHQHITNKDSSVEIHPWSPHCKFFRLSRQPQWPCCTNFKHWLISPLSLLLPWTIFFLHQLTFHYSNSEFVRFIRQLLKIARAVVGATVIKCGISNGDAGALIRVVESMVVPVVGHLADLPILPAMASDVKGSIV